MAPDFLVMLIIANGITINFTHTYGINMKANKTYTSIASAVLLSLGLAGASFAEEESKLSVGGFIDMSYFYSDVDGSDSTSDWSLDQAEINLGYDFGNKLTATVDVEYQNADEGVDLEQAFLTYSVSDEFSVKAGRFLSYSGWEAEEPTGLFQYSGTGYAAYFYGYYQQGVSAMYSGEKFSAAVSVVSDLAGPQSTDVENPGIETMIAITPTDEITVKAFYSVDGDTTLFNTWGSYSKDALTLALEYNTAEDSVFTGSDASGYLAMANYAFDSFAVTLRYHAWEIEDATGATYEDANGITISPSFAVNDNLLIVTEYRMDEVNDVDGNYIAVEALVTF